MGFFKDKECEYLGCEIVFQPSGGNQKYCKKHSRIVKAVNNRKRQAAWQLKRKIKRNIGVIAEKK